MFSAYLLRVLICLHFLSSFTCAVRLPIGQLDPSPHAKLDTHEGDNVALTVLDWYFDNRYCFNYPDISCYVRSGNGWTAGDTNPWSITSCTDRSGLGSVMVRYPESVDGLNLDDNTIVDGLRHPDAYGRPLGLRVHLASFSSRVQFGSNGAVIATFDVPIARWDQGSYVPFHADPGECYTFALLRVVLYGKHDFPPPYENPFPPGEHDEL